MTVIAWDGEYLAVDRQASYGSVRYTTTKAKQLDHNGPVLAYCGNQSAGEALMAWYENGRKVEEWPACQSTDHDAILVVVKVTGEVEFYERTPHPLKVMDSCKAWGSGADLALGAMLMHASARLAVNICCDRLDSCGMGIDVFGPFPDPLKTHSG
jgi:hypothetical protein